VTNRKTARGRGYTGGPNDPSMSEGPPMANFQVRESRPVMGGGTASGKHCDLCNAGPLRFMEQYPHQGKTLCPACYKKEKV
jgi:hypothetical protein